MASLKPLDVIEASPVRLRATRLVPRLRFRDARGSIIGRPALGDPCYRPKENAMKRMSVVVVLALCMLALCSCESSKIGDSPKELTLYPGNKVTMKLALIPAGKFMMGSPETENGRVDSEGPHREVTISKRFYMGVYEVTQDQYEAVIGNNPSRFKDVENPVERVSWNDAVEFCKKLSAKTGKKVRLPTEAQWEYACRAGTNTRFGFGDKDADLGNYAWYSANSGDKTHPVGQKKPNAWGLYDMHGNAWEWCSDWTGAASDTYRVLRGGSWLNLPRFCRSAVRIRDTPVGRCYDIGFRVAVDLE
jgi:eukaryotic-like serine/threonine-protein kinase